MGVLNIQIVSPVHGQWFSGNAQVIMSGRLIKPPTELELKNGDLYYRWYSSLCPGYITDNPKHNIYSMNGTEGIEITRPDEAYSATVGVGSHVITFAVTDIQSEDPDKQKNVSHGGVTGGDTKGPSPCIIHVFRAEIISVDIVQDDKTNEQQLKIRVAGPIAWNVKDPDGEGFIYNWDYDKINRIKYRFGLRRDPPDDPDDAHQTVPLNPEPEELTVDTEVADGEEIDPGVLLYAPTLEPELTGVYTLTLYVEDKNGEFELEDNIDTATLTF